MKLLGALAFSTLALVLLKPGGLSAEPAAVLEIAWEKEKGAVSYELEAESVTGRGPRRIFKTKETHLQENLPAGEYFLRIRSVNEDGMKSKWSAPVTVNASPPEVVALYPSPGEKVVAKTISPKLKLAWQKVAGAQAYSVNVWNKETKKKQQFIVNGNSLPLTFQVGQTYRWTVSLKDITGVVYETAQPPFEFSVIGDRLATPEIKEIDLSGETLKLHWTTVPHAEEYELKFFRRDILGSDWQVVLEEKVARDNRWTPPGRLAPGEYRVEMVAHAANYLSSEKLTHQFVVKPKLDELAEIR